MLLNTAAVALELGSGGLHFVVARLARPGHEPLAGREAGTVELRYTPLQHRVLSVEDEASPHRAAVAAFETLAGMPVVCCGNCTARSPRRQSRRAPPRPGCAWSS